MTDLPKTNYDLVKEEHQNLGMSERQLITLLTKEFTPLIRQPFALPVEFDLTTVHFQAAA